MREVNRTPDGQEIFEAKATESNETKPVDLEQIQDQKAERELAVKNQEIEDAKALESVREQLSENPEKDGAQEGAVENSESIEDITESAIEIARQLGDFRSFKSDVPVILDLMDRNKYDTKNGLGVGTGKEFFENLERNPQYAKAFLDELDKPQNKHLLKMNVFVPESYNVPDDEPAKPVNVENYLYNLSQNAPDMPDVSELESKYKEIYNKLPDSMHFAISDVSMGVYNERTIQKIRDLVNG